MEKCIIDLFNAVTNINIRYYRATGTRADGTPYNQETEASFSAELFHRFKVIMEEPINNLYYCNLFLHYDITKGVINGRPDIVLHQAQENRIVQKIFIEVKTDSDANLNDDFQKLISATDDVLHFENAVMIIANRSFEQSKILITRYFQYLNIGIERLRRMYLINAEIKTDNSIDYNLFNFSQINVVNE